MRLQAPTLSSAAAGERTDRNLVSFEHMIEKTISNNLYLAVLPVIHMETGVTEQILTLIPDESLATEFFPDEVESYTEMFQKSTKYLSGGHVTGYNCTLEQSESGRTRVRVTQNVR